jgi:hypothetical protein
MQQQTELLRQQAESLRIQNQNASAAALRTAAPAVPVTPAPNAVMNPGSGAFTTDGLLNGRAWQSWPDAVKFVYISGYIEGAASGKQEPWALTPSPTLGAVRDSLDGFYQAPGNRKVPLGVAMYWIHARSGMSDTAIKDYEMILRLHYDK